MNSWVFVTYRVALVTGLALLGGGGDWIAVRESPRILRTSPSCDDIVGYSGPNDCEICLDEAGRIESVRVMRSGDTVEHAEAVRTNTEFLARFVGLSESHLDGFTAIDGVSRATLTSLAVVEAVAKRLGGQPPALRFPESITIAEVKKIVPSVSQLDAVPPTGTAFGIFVSNRAGERVAWAVRTGSLTESVIGYQGPTDTLLVFSPDQERLLGLSLRRSYDNDEYVGYVRDDRYFAEQLIGKSLTELAHMSRGFDRDRSIDGVSGATMTSQAVAEGIVRTAARLQTGVAPPLRTADLRARDVGMWIALALALLLTFSRLRGHRRLRLVTRIAMVVYLGILSGDMLSQGLLVGWVENGLPSGAAPGLIALAAVAVLIPVTTGRQTYCHQLCAHGALQELLRGMPWRRPIPPKAYRVLRCLPGGLLIVSATAFVLALGGFPHAGIEPFGAWAWPLAGWATCTVALASLVAASFYPMSYCRVACPTGYLLDFLRRRDSDHFRRRDAVGFGLLVLAAIVRLGGSG